MDTPQRGGAARLPTRTSALPADGGAGPPVSKLSSPVERKPSGCAPTPVPTAKSKTADATQERCGAAHWHVSYEQARGKRVDKWFTTAQIEDLIALPTFDLGAKAARDERQPKQSLAAFPEFEQALQARLAKAKVTEKSLEYARMYQKVEQDGDGRERREWFVRWRRWAEAEFGPLLWLALLAGGLYAVRQLFVLCSRWVAG